MYSLTVYYHPEFSQEYKFSQKKALVMDIALVFLVIGIIGATGVWAMTPTASYALLGIGIGGLFGTAMTLPHILKLVRNQNDQKQSKLSGKGKISQLPVDLSHANALLKERVVNVPQYTENDVATLTSVYTPVNCIFEGVYLGNYRAFLSIDPHFLEKHSATETLDDLRDVGLTFSSDTYLQMSKGCSDKNIKLVISVTQFQPGPGVPIDDWSRFTPDLDTLNIKRIQIQVNDDDDAWKGIELQLESVFQAIDQMRANGENVLIHCVEGSSRSAALVYAYLMSRCNVTLDQAFNFVRSLRPHVQLKPAMRKGLENYYSKLHPSEAMT